MTTVGAAVIAGVAVLLAGSLAWGALLAPLSLRVLVAVPWAIVPMAAYLWVYWRFVQVAAFVLLSAAAWWSCSQTARLTHAGRLETA